MFIVMDRDSNPGKEGNVGIREVPGMEENGDLVAWRP